MTIRTILVLTAPLLFLTVPTLAENRVNIMTGEYEVVPPGYELQFNKMTGDWAFAPPRSQLEFNHSTLEFELPGAMRPRSNDPMPWDYRRWQYDTQRDGWDFMERQYDRR
jgi:hypothetical protein